MNKADIPFLSATALGELIRQREISPVEATEAYLERIDTVDGTLHSYITVCRQEALASRPCRGAGAGTWRVSRAASRGALRGQRPVLDQGHANDWRLDHSRRFCAQEDATVVARLRAAGAVLLGKLNMSEFATGNSVHHPYGTPHNPWDLARNPGTSSSGSGAATAAFLCATSLGEDTGRLHSQPSQ